MQSLTIQEAGPKMLITLFPKQQLMKLCRLPSYLQMHIICRSNFFHSKDSLYCVDLKPKQRSVQCAKCLSTSMHLRGNTFQRIKQTYSIMTISNKINIAAVLVYEKCVDSIDWEDFINYFKLPDTFQSWFLGMQLHMWMCITIVIVEKKGRLFRNKLVENMWQDVEFRLDKLTYISRSDKKRYLSEMCDQFQAALVSYDEGILSNDMVLAATVWRTFFNFGEVDPLLLESMVIYIRKQMCHLDSLHLEDMMFRGSISFLPLKNIVQSIGNDNSQ